MTIQTAQPYIGRTAYRYWFISQDLYTADPDFVYTADDQTHIPAGLLVNYNPTTCCAIALEGKYEGWIAPFVRRGVSPLPALEQLAREAE
jgi:hypothetical protein